VVLSPTRRQLVTFAVLIAFGPVVGSLISTLVLATARGNWSEVAARVVSSLLMALVFGPIWYLLYRGQHCGLTPQGISSSNGFRSSGIWWADVVAIEETRFFGTRGITVVARHRSMRLRAPVSGSGWLFANPDFDAQLATIRSWWQACAPRRYEQVPYSLP
jgi:hypothetical protein